MMCASRRAELEKENARPWRCVNPVALWGRIKEGFSPDLESFVSTPSRRRPREPPPLPAPADYGVHRSHRACGGRRAPPSPRSGEGVAEGDGWGVESRALGPQVRGDGRAIRLGPKQRATPHPAP